MLNKPDKIIVHHTGGTDRYPLMDTSHHTAEQVRQWHLSKGWDDIGYHWFIEKGGEIQAGRDEKMHGAHTRGHNTKSIGICLAGNFDATMPTQAQEDSLTWLLKEVMERWDIDYSEIYPHRKFANKTCYGKKLDDQWASMLVKPEAAAPSTCKGEYDKEEIVGTLKKIIKLLQDLIKKLV